VDRILDAIFLGVVQGLTEFLPVSSSGHLALFQALLGWKDPSENMAFNIAVHVGSLGAVIVFVRREIVAMLTTKPRLILVLLIATLPVAVAGLLGAKSVVEHLSESLIWVGVFLCCTGGILGVARRLEEGDQAGPELGSGKALLVGLAQVLALLPGVSRSGTTLAAGLGVGLRREEAVRFAFLMAGPAIFGAGLLAAIQGPWPATLPHGALAAGTLVSFVVSLFAMRVMVGVVVRRRLGWFAAYCALAGAVAIVAALVRP